MRPAATHQPGRCVPARTAELAVPVVLLVPAGLSWLRFCRGLLHGDAEVEVKENWPLTG